jgi:hypothetical protein
VVHHQIGDDTDAALVGGGDEALEVLDGAVVGVDRVEVGDVVAAVAQRRGVHGQQPDAVDAQPGEVVELLGQPEEVARAVVVAVEEPAQMDLVEDGALEPERVALEPVLGRGDLVLLALGVERHRRTSRTCAWREEAPPPPRRT